MTYSGHPRVSGRAEDGTDRAPRRCADAGRGPRAARAGTAGRVGDVVPRAVVPPAGLRAGEPSMQSNRRRGWIVRVLALAAASFAIAGLAGCDADRGRPSVDAAPTAERVGSGAPESGAPPGEPG